MMQILYLKRTVKFSLLLVVNRSRILNNIIQLDELKKLTLYSINMTWFELMLI